LTKGRQSLSGGGDGDTWGRRKTKGSGHPEGEDVGGAGERDGEIWRKKNCRIDGRRKKSMTNKCPTANSGPEKNRERECKKSPKKKKTQFAR